MPSLDALGRGYTIEQQRPLQAATRPVTLQSFVVAFDFVTDGARRCDRFVMQRRQCARKRHRAQQHRHVDARQRRHGR